MATRCLTDPDPLRPLRVPYEEFRYGRGHTRGVHKVLGAMWRQGGDGKLREQFFAIRAGDGPVARLYDVLTKTEER